MLRLAGLPLAPDGPGDHMDAELAKDDRALFSHSAGRPADGDSLRSRGRARLRGQLPGQLGASGQLGRAASSSARLPWAGRPSRRWRGAAKRSSATRMRSADGWYSCHSCHYEGGTNAVTMDTKNDGSFGTYKMVLSLRNAQHTGPWFWHGWQDDLTAAVAQEPGRHDARARAHATTTCTPCWPISTRSTPPPNSRQCTGQRDSRPRPRARQASLSPATRPIVPHCHSGPYFTDGQKHDVGLGSRYDEYEGYNTPSLLDVANRARLLAPRPRQVAWPIC